MIKDKVVVITGASSGIGEATAKRLAKAGAKVVLGARREERLVEITKQIQKEGGTAAFLKTDVTKREDSKALVEFAEKKFVQVDAIFLNAGVMPVSRLSELKVDDWDRTIDINIKGVLYGIAAALPIFKKQNHGQVIATSSVAGLKVYPGYAAYCASKWAVREIMSSLRMEAAQDKANIKTTTIYPAATHSELVNGIANSDIQKGEMSSRSNFELSADEVAKAVEYVIDAPQGTDIEDLTIAPLNQEW